MDAALALESIVPTAEYFGSLTENTEAAYDALQWNDERPKPTWAQIVEAFNDLPAVVPQRVTMRQARLALLGAGLLSQVEEAIDALPEPPRTAARIEWDFSSEVYRDRDFVIMLGTSLGLAESQIDDLFITAATL